MVEPNNKSALHPSTEKDPAERLRERLNYLIDECGIDGVQLSKNTGIPVTTINRLRNASIESNPTLTTLVPIAGYFNITVSQLIGDEPLPNNRTTGEHKPDLSLWQTIPILSFDQAADWPTEKQKILKSNARSITSDLDISDYAFAAVMEGDSMYPRFPEGTLLILDPKLNIRHRDFVLLLHHGQEKPVFKQVLINGPDYYLKSLNEDFKEVIKINLENYKTLGIMVQARTERSP